MGVGKARKAVPLRRETGSTFGIAPLITRGPFVPNTLYSYSTAPNSVLGGN